MHFIGPVGAFTLPRRTPEVVMLAQGIGITPFRSMLRHIEITGADKRTTLVHTGAHHPFRTDTETAATAAHYPTSRVTGIHSLRHHATQSCLNPPVATHAGHVLRVLPDRFAAHTPTKPLPCTRCCRPAGRARPVPRRGPQPPRPVARRAQIRAHTRH